MSKPNPQTTPIEKSDFVAELIEKVTGLKILKISVRRDGAYRIYALAEAVIHEN